MSRACDRRDTWLLYLSRRIGTRPPQKNVDPVAPGAVRDCSELLADDVAGEHRGQGREDRESGDRGDRPPLDPGRDHRLIDRGSSASNRSVTGAFSKIGFDQAGAWQAGSAARHNSRSIPGRTWSDMGELGRERAGGSQTKPPILVSGVCLPKYALFASVKLANPALCARIWEVVCPLICIEHILVVNLRRTK